MSETSAPWGALPRLYDDVMAAARGAFAELGVTGCIMCHLSHSYHSGACLYFTFAFKPAPAATRSTEYDLVKGAIQQAFVDNGATLSHHHAVGTEHAQWLEQDISAPGVAMLRALFDGVDPGEPQPRQDRRPGRPAGRRRRRLTRAARGGSTRSGTVHPGLQDHPGHNDLGGFLMRRMLLLGMIAVFALGMGAVAVQADDGGGDGNSRQNDHASCVTATGGDDDAAGADDNGNSGEREGSDQGDDENGTSSDDVIDGNAGNDDISGAAGDDDLCGDTGDDHMAGGQGNDKMAGGPGDDVENGQAGNDDIEGDDGNDRINGGPGVDFIRAGRGNDRIFARDSRVDHISCGSGTDTVIADRGDAVAASCEHVSRR